MNCQEFPIANTPMLNLYPDSLGGSLADAVSFLKREEVLGAFSSLYILPSIFNSDVDRGFSVISYELNELFATSGDLKAIKALGIELKLDFILNHISILSEQFQDILRRGEASACRDFFIDWNRFWAGYGQMTDGGYIQPDETYLKDMFIRKPGLPLLMVDMPDGSRKPYWNTFQQEIQWPRLETQDLMRAANMQYASARELAALVNEGLDAGRQPEDIPMGRFEHARQFVNKLLQSGKKYLGQMDLNVESPMVWEYYRHTLNLLANYGTRIIRLDAFAYAHKRPGAHNFLNEPETWDLLARINEMAGSHHLLLLPEIHASYGDHVHDKIALQGFLCYDFFLPGIILDALERGKGELIAQWANELQDKGIHAVNMLGCHDGIPLMDLRGLMPDERINSLVDTVVSRGGLLISVNRQKNIYYQVNATYFSALGENIHKMLLARALQLFMPGKPQIWYLDLFAGRNDFEAVSHAGSDSLRDINRSNLSQFDLEQGLKQALVRDQLSLLRFRNTFPAFGFDSNLKVDVSDDKIISFRWDHQHCTAMMNADLAKCTFDISGIDQDRKIIYRFEQA